MSATLLEAPLDPKEASRLALDLASRFLERPAHVKALAQELGLWDDLRAVLDEPLNLEHARRDVNVFIEYAIKTNEGEPTFQADFHVDWQEMLSQPGASLIMAPRGHGKSVQVSGRLAWELGRSPHIRIKIVCATDDAAKELIDMLYKQITANPLVARVFPDLKVDSEMADRTDAFSIVGKAIGRDPSVKASGVLGAGAGGRADILVCDDVVDEKNAVLNPADRPKVIGALRNVWFALIAKGGKLWWLCTPYHVEDATHVFRRENNFNREWKRPAIGYKLRFNEDGTPVVDPVTRHSVQDPYALWPQVWSLEALAERRVLVGPIAFTRQYMLKVQSDEDLTFPKDLVLAPSYDRTLWKIGQAMPLDGKIGDIPAHWPTFAGIDLASSLENRSAFFAMWTIAYCPDNGRLYLKDLVRQKADFYEIVDEIAAAHDRHRWEFAYVEKNSFQTVITTVMDREHKHIPIEGFHTGVNKNTETTGLKGMATIMSKGGFVIPARDVDTILEDDQSPFGIFWNELTSYPGARYSDTVMALWFAWQAFRVGYDPILQDYGDYCSAS